MLQQSINPLKPAVYFDRQSFWLWQLTNAFISAFELFGIQQCQLTTVLPLKKSYMCIYHPFLPWWGWFSDEVHNGSITHLSIKWKMGLGLFKNLEGRLYNVRYFIHGNFDLMENENSFNRFRTFSLPLSEQRVGGFLEIMCYLQKWL